MIAWDRGFLSEWAMKQQLTLHDSQWWLSAVVFEHVALLFGEYAGERRFERLAISTDFIVAARSIRVFDRELWIKQFFKNLPNVTIVTTW